LYFFYIDRQEQLDRLMEKLNEHDKKIEAIKSQAKTETITIEETE
jgi:hypothetical protein